jgi:HK97 gp10 family phage protein
VARLKTRLKAIADATPEASKKALLATGADILAVAKQLVPVDTSSLKTSGGAVPVDSNTVHVGFGGPGVYYEGREPEQYAQHVEYGTVLSAAQPFLRPAFMQGKDTFAKRVLDEMSKLR